MHGERGERDPGSACSGIRGLGMGLFVDPFDWSDGLGGIVRLDGLEADFARRFWLVSDCKG